MEIKGASPAYELLKPVKNNEVEQQYKFNFETPTSVVVDGEKEFKMNFQGAVPAEVLMKKVESMNELLKSNETAVKFNVHEELARVYVQVVSKETDEVIKEIPPEDFLNMVATMLKNVGLIVDERV